MTASSSVRPGSSAIVVTGAGGFIGRRLCRLLTARGQTVAAWTRTFVNLEDAAAVADRMADARPMLVFHLAAAGVDAACAHDPGLIAREVAMTAALVGSLPAGARLVIAGSMSEYGTAGILDERDAPAPGTAYAVAKLAAGHYAAAYGPGRGLDVRIARLFGVYGPGEGPKRLFPALLAALREHRPIQLSDGLQRRDFIHVDDAADALIRLADVPPDDIGRLVNIGTGVAVAVRDVAHWIAAAQGAPVGLLHFGARPRSPGDADLLCAETSRMRRVLGVVPPQRLMPGLTLDLFG